MRLANPIAFASLLDDILSSAYGFISLIQFSNISYKSLPFYSIEVVITNIVTESRL